MKLMPGFTDFFISPVTGRILLQALPDLYEDYIWIGNYNDRPIPSPALIDLELELIRIRSRLAETDFIIGHKAPGLLNSQALDELIPGILWQNDGVVSIATLSPGNLWIGDDFGYPSEIVILPLANMANLPSAHVWVGDDTNRPVPSTTLPIGTLPDLPYHNIWIGDETNRPVAQGRIWDDGVGDGNLPAYTSDQYKMIWRMNPEGVPILVTDLTDLEDGVTTIVSEIASIFDSISRLFSSIASIISSVNSILSTISTILGQIDSILSSIASILDTLSGMEITIEFIEEEITTIDGEITEIFDTLTTIGGEITDLTARVVTLEGEMATVIDDIATIEGDIATIEGEIATIEGDIATIEGEIATIEGEIATLEGEIATLEGEIATIEAEIATLEGEIATIEGEIATIEGEIATLTADVATLDADVATLDTEVAALDAEVTALYDAIAVLNAEVDIIQDQILALQAWEAIETEKMAAAEANITTLFGLVSDPITLTGDVTGIGYLNVPIPTTLTLTLDEIPLAADNVSLNGHQINSLAMAGSPAGTDAVNVDYLSSFVGGGTVILTGDVTGSGHVNDGGFSTTFTLHLNQIPLATGNVNINTYKLINVVDPSSAQDAATKHYVDNSTITLTGDVTGSGSINGSFATTLTLTLNQIPLAAGNVNLNTHKLINVVDPTSAQDAATKNYIDNSTITLTGDVTGSGNVNGSFATTLTLTLDQIPLAAGNVNLNSHQINNLAMAGSPAGTDAVNVTYLNSKIAAGTVILTGNVTGSGHVNDGGFATTLVLTLDQIPLAAANVNINTHKLINVVDPSSAQDAATKHYVDNSTITLTGDVTGSGSVNGSFATTLVLTLDQIPHAAANVNLNSHQINNLAMAGSPASTDAVNVSYLNSRIGAGTVTLLGAVTGSGLVNDGGFTTTLASTVNMASGGETFSYGSSVSAAAFTLLSNFTPVTLTPSNIELTLQNSIGSGFHFLLTSSTSLQTYPDGVFKFYAFTASTSTEIYKCDSTLFTFDIPVTINNVLSMASNQINNLAMAGSPAGTDAVNVSYLNTRINAGTVILTGAVTGSGNVNDGGFATTLATTININGATETFSFPSANQVTEFVLLTNYTPTLGNDSFLELSLQNSIGAGYYFQLDSSYSGGVFPNGRLFLYTSANTALFHTDGSTFFFDIPIKMNGVALNMNGNQINNLAMAGSPASTDAVNINYLTTYVASQIGSGTVILNGAVTGSGHVNDGGFTTTLNSTINVSAGNQTFNFPSSADTVDLILTSNYTTTAGHDAYLAFVLQNAAGNGYFWEVDYTYSGGTYPNGKLTLFGATPGPTYTSLYMTDGSTFNFYLPLNMNSHKITSLTDPSSAQDAATKNYVDTKTLDTFALAAANVNINTHKLINVVDPTSAQDAATKNYVDSYKSYGVAYTLTSSGTQSITANTWTVLNCFDASSTSNFSLTSNNHLKYTGTPSCNAYAVASLSFSTSALCDVYIGIGINGNPSSSQQIGPLTAATGTHYSLTVSGMFATNTNDSFSVYVYCTSSITLTNNGGNINIMTF